MNPKQFHKAEKGRRSDSRAPRQVHDLWGYSNKTVYISSRKPGLPIWLLALVAFALIAVMVFWGVPALVAGVQSIIHPDQMTGQDQISLLYDASTWTCSEPIADLFEQDDIKAGRLSQVLYNEPVHILSTNCTPGFAFVELEDGTVGYMLTENLVDSRQSIEPDRFRFKLIVVDTQKRIMSHARQGTLLVEVPMGTVLFADYRGNGISRIDLPDGQVGWISDEGVIVLEPFEDILPAADGQRFFTSTAMAFNQITALDGGQSVRGISTIGIARLAGMINGYKLPRLLEDMTQVGQAVEFEPDETDGLASLDNLLEADLVFFRDEAGLVDGAVDMAICVGDGQVLFAGEGQSSIRLIDLTVDEALRSRILFARRLYD